MLIEDLVSNLDEKKLLEFILFGVSSKLNNNLNRK